MSLDFKTNRRRFIQYPGHSAHVIKITALINQLHMANCATQIPFISLYVSFIFGVYTRSNHGFRYVTSPNCTTSNNLCVCIGDIRGLPCTSATALNTQVLYSGGRFSVLLSINVSLMNCGIHSLVTHSSTYTMNWIRP